MHAATAKVNATHCLYSLINSNGTNTEVFSASVERIRVASNHQLSDIRHVVSNKVSVSSMYRPLVSILVYTSSLLNFSKYSVSQAVLFRTIENLTAQYLNSGQYHRHVVFTAFGAIDGEDDGCIRQRDGVPSWREDLDFDPLNIPELASLDPRFPDFVILEGSATKKNAASPKAHIDASNFIFH